MPVKCLTPIIGLMLTFFLAACSAIDDTWTVKVAVSLPIKTSSGQSFLDGIQFALNEVNGKAGDTSVELLTFDTTDPNDPNGSPSAQLEGEVAAKAAADDAVVAFIGSYSTQQAEASTALLNEASIPHIVLSGWPGLTRPGFAAGEPGKYYPTGRRHVFRIGPGEDVEAMAAIEWMGEMGIENVYLVSTSDGASAILSEIFAVNAPEEGVDVLAHDVLAMEADADDFKTVAERVIAAQPDMVYYVADNPNFITALHEIDPTFPIMSTHALLDESLFTQGDNDLANNVYLTDRFVPVGLIDDEAAQSFTQLYRDTYDADPSKETLAGYEAMVVALAAIERAEQPTPREVLSAMENLGEFSGILGNWSFDVNGEQTIYLISTWQFEDGRWNFIQVIEE
jgi:branched-chain amino acid transport system substrate-binding protein